MVNFLDQTVAESTREKIQHSKFFGVITDESMDIAVYKKLIIYLQVLVKGTTEVIFLENKEVKDGKSDTIVESLIEVLEKWEIPLGRVTGLGSDGAAVMTGKRSGVGWYYFTG